MFRDSKVAAIKGRFHSCETDVIVICAEEDCSGAKGEMGKGVKDGLVFCRMDCRWKVAGRASRRSVWADQAKRAIKARKNALAQHAWKPSDQSGWLSGELYPEQVQPRLATLSASAIARRISVSRWYAGRIREGYRPHPRHWRKLAELVRVSPHPRKPLHANGG